MNIKTIVSTLLLFTPIISLAAGGDDPLLSKIMIDQLEQRNGDKEDPVVLEAEMWIGKDLNKFWLKSEVEQVEGKTEEAEVQALYSRAITPYWDLQTGWRRDYKPEPQQDWFVLGVDGLAPYFFEVGASLFIGEDNRSAFRFEAEYEIMLTQRLVLSPEIELNFYGKDDKEHAIGSGLADSEIGLRLRYEFWREFAPYIGITREAKHGRTADMAIAKGEETEETQAVAGFRFWF